MDEERSKDCSFSSQFRILRRREFLKIYKTGKKLFAHNLVIALTKSESGSSRVGITVSRKIDKRATRRNRFKRCIREIFRLHRHEFRAAFDIVVTARKDAPACSADELARQFMGALQRGGYLIDTKESP